MWLWTVVGGIGEAGVDETNVGVGTDMGTGMGVSGVGKDRTAWWASLRVWVTWSCWALAWL